MFILSQIDCFLFRGLIGQRPPARVPDSADDTDAVTASSYPFHFISPTPNT